LQQKAKTIRSKKKGSSEAPWDESSRTLEWKSFYRNRRESVRTFLISEPLDSRPLLP
jgi:hypothetical protein